MKRYNYLPSLLFMFIAGILSSCSNDEHYDFPGDADNKVYIKAGASTEFTITHTPVSDATNFEFQVQAGCRMKPDNALTVELAIDTSLVAAYNVTHGTTYKAIPSDYFTIENTTIEADTMGAKTPGIVTLKEEKLKELTNESGYLVPVKVASVIGGALPSTNLNITYATIAIQSDNDNIDDKGSVWGELNNDRSSWTAFTSLDITPDAEAAKAFDDDASSTWSISNKDPFDVIIDMGKSYNVCGLYANNKYYGYYDQPVIKNGTEIFVSEDNNTWSSMGKVTKDNQNIVFYAPMKIRYIKWNVPTSTDWYRPTNAELSIADFNVYVK